MVTVIAATCQTRVPTLSTSECSRSTSRRLASVWRVSSQRTIRSQKSPTAPQMTTMSTATVSRGNTTSGAHLVVLVGEVPGSEVPRLEADDHVVARRPHIGRTSLGTDVPARDPLGDLGGSLVDDLRDASHLDASERELRLGNQDGGSGVTAQM